MICEQRVLTRFAGGRGAQLAIALEPIVEASRTDHVPCREREAVGIVTGFDFARLVGA